ncbi:ParA family protein, partial [Vibrio sp. Vb0932]
MIVWSVANQKGGVGKTTSTVTLAGLLSQKGHRVLMVDTDPHASLTTYLGYDSDTVSSSLFDLFQLKTFTRDTVKPLILETELEGMDIIPAHMSLATLDRVMGNRSGMGLILKRALQAVSQDYDYVLIDCPPILGVMM